jgi:hypothetical protein
MMAAREVYRNVGMDPYEADFTKRIEAVDAALERR